MALCVVALDMLKIRCILESWDVPVQISQPLVDRWETGSDVPEVGLGDIVGCRAGDMRERR